MVGVDGSEVSSAAIRFAFGEAARRHVGITAVHAAMPSRRQSSVRVPADIVEQVDRQLVAEAMDSKRILIPGIDVKTKVVHSHPVQALLDGADGAELIVVGSRGRGGFTGMVLGSVSQAVLRHAPCPVAVVHPRQTKVDRPSPAQQSVLQIAVPSRFADQRELS
ncbi:universal stress protein [Kribbella sp. NPDC026596]|uniref:universal stress protein n=1 Tax=Kribbella sp. NPDC026596 TaxID=3155122 RepID=UPI0033D1D157